MDNGRPAGTGPDRVPGVPPKTPFPFSAIVGQLAFRRALLLGAINPGIGGVLIRGSKGTAKSTAVRSLAALLPPVDVVAGCPYNCAGPGDQADCIHCAADGTGEVSRRAVRIVELPLGASEERLSGMIDAQHGSNRFEPGLLAAAHRGILYVDDINLLADPLVDRLLDAAAMGYNHVEREGVSVRHPANFILVGTMNPEEGELRPGLLDRFGLIACTDDQLEAPDRAEIVRRRVSFEANPMRFAGRWRDEEAELQHRLVAARDMLDKVDVPEQLLEAIVRLCAEERAEGARADLAMYHTARTIAAWDGRAEVDPADVREAALLALPHRQRRRPAYQLDPDRLDELLAPLRSAAAG